VLHQFREPVKLGIITHRHWLHTFPITFRGGKRRKVNSAPEATVTGLPPPPPPPPQPAGAPAACHQGSSPPSPYQPAGAHRRRPPGSSSGPSHPSHAATTGGQRACSLRAPPPTLLLGTPRSTTSVAPVSCPPAPRVGPALRRSERRRNCAGQHGAHIKTCCHWKLHRRGSPDAGLATAHLLLCPLGLSV
jgi:hypothetical protein